VSFLTLHILNLCTTLTSATALARYNTQTSFRSLNTPGDSVPGSRKVDITSPSIANVLASLAKADFDTSVSNDSDTDIIVKISPPVYIRVAPPISPAASTDSSDMIETFMTNWTRLVGDPVLSKWIVLVLAISVALNGYLLKGIAAGGVRGLQPQGVRFRSIGGNKREQETNEEEAAVAEVLKVVEPPKISIQSLPERRNISPMVAPIAIPATPSRAAFILDTVDEKLRQQEAADRLRNASSSSSASPTDLVKGEMLIRSLEECIDIFNNGPRPVSVALSMLNDEEIILLAKNGKIAAYALEKVLGDLERAVRIRRALICELFSVLFPWLC
jgi:hydroxymethylglutaryl-CoA reductase (NADPH)